MTVPKAEQRLGLTMEAISVDIMLANAKHSLERGFVLKTKEMVYYYILQYLQLEGYPTETNPDFNKANVSDLVLYIIGPIIAEFNRKTGCKLRLRRKKNIISTNNEPGGIEEFVVMDRISEKDNRFVLVVGAGGGGEAMKQCLKDARDGNDGGVVYGFFTTGETWRMLKYDGIFQMSENMKILFNTMDGDKERWMKSYSIPR